MPREALPVLDEVPQRLLNENAERRSALEMLSATSLSTPGAAFITRRTSSRYWSAARASPSPAMSACIPVRNAWTASRHSFVRQLYVGCPGGALLDENTPGIRSKYGTMLATSPSSRWALSCLCVPRTLSTSCDQAVFVDHATDASVSPDVVSLKIDRFG